MGAFLTVVLVWEHLSMIHPPIQLPVTAWKDALEMAVMLSVQAFLTVVLVWEHLSIILLLIQLHVTVWKDDIVMTLSIPWNAILMMVIAATKIPVTEVAHKIASMIGLLTVQAANANKKTR